jgi:hypothetical protein
VTGKESSLAQILGLWVLVASISEETAKFCGILTSIEVLARGEPERRWKLRRMEVTCITPCT